MKYLLLLSLIGFAAAASIHRASQDPEDKIEEDLAVVSSLVHVLDFDDSQVAEEGGDHEISEAKKKLRESFEKLLQKIKETLDKESEVRDLLEDAKELNHILKDLKVGLSDKGKELYEKVKERALTLLEKLVDRFDGELPISLKEDGMQGTLQKFKEGFTAKFRKLKSALLPKVDKEALKQRIEKTFGKGTETAEKLFTFLKDQGEKGKNKLLDIVESFLDEKENREERSISDLWEKVRGYFNKGKAEIKEKYVTFSEWAREKMGPTLESLKIKSDKAKEIAEELKENAESLSKEVLTEGVEFLRPYKAELGKLWDDLKESVKDILKKND